MMLKGCQENPQDSNYGRLYGGGGRLLRHLLPRPSTSITKNFAPCCPVSTGYCSCAHSNKLFSMNHQQTSAADHVHSRKEEKHMEHIVSTRWNPTPEQLMALEEMYRRGVRTPSSEEIKLIAAKLKQFGKIEGKNVFYWFQNHKARERQKRRRQPEPIASNKLGNDQETLEENTKGLGRTYLEVQDNNKLITSSKETNVSKEGPMVTEEGEMQHMKSQRKMAKDSSVDLLSSKASDTFLNATNSSGNQEEQQKMMVSTLNFSLFSSSSACDVMINKEDQTLELFPLQKDGANEMDFKEYRDSMNLSSIVPPNQFYEFL